MRASIIFSGASFRAACCGERQCSIWESQKCVNDPFGSLSSERLQMGFEGKERCHVEATQGSVGGKAAEKQLDELKALVSALPA